MSTAVLAVGINSLMRRTSKQLFPHAAPVIALRLIHILCSNFLNYAGQKTCRHCRSFAILGACVSGVNISIALPAVANQIPISVVAISTGKIQPMHSPESEMKLKAIFDQEGLPLAAPVNPLICSLSSIRKCSIPDCNRPW